jgi:branched-chain amino acid aminotransferase
MSTYVWLNGEMVPSREASLSVHNGGWLHGAGLFETMRAEYGRVFRLENHLNRLMRSAEKILSPVDRELLPTQTIAGDLMRENGLVNARMRLTVTSGDVLDTVRDGQDRLTVCATVAALESYPTELYKSGVSVKISSFRQTRFDPVVGHKTTSYLPRLLAMREAHASGCAEVIWFTHENLLAEGSISNVFVVKGGVVRTPPVDTPVLPGIARGVVLELCNELSIGFEERSLTINDLLDADEVFLTNSIMQVLPVRMVERHEIASGLPGAITNQLLQGYRNSVRKECQDVS